jgi:hypothetical protein
MLDGGWSTQFIYRFINENGEALVGGSYGTTRSVPTILQSFHE